MTMSSKWDRRAVRTIPIIESERGIHSSPKHMSEDQPQLKAVWQEVSCWWHL
jgi:hypothetical protein